MSVRYSGSASTSIRVESTSTVHHTNEVAQSECGFDASLGSFWMHNEFLALPSADGGDEKVQVEGECEDAERSDRRGIDPLAFRYFFLQAHYRQQQSFSTRRSRLRLRSSDCRRSPSRSKSSKARAIRTSGAVLRAISRCACGRPERAARDGRRLGGRAERCARTPIVATRSSLRARAGARWGGARGRSADEWENDPRIDALVADRRQRGRRGWATADRSGRSCGRGDRDRRLPVLALAAQGRLARPRPCRQPSVRVGLYCAHEQRLQARVRVRAVRGPAGGDRRPCRGDGSGRQHRRSSADRSGKISRSPA